MVLHMYNYCIETDFDDANQDVVRSKSYYSALSRYRALGIGHKEGTSTMFLSKANPLDIAVLKKDLGDIEILSVNAVLS